MPPERRERSNNNEAYQIQLSIPFKPYERTKRFYFPRKGESPIIVPERYEYVLALRKRVSLYGMEGVIDIISENPEAWAKSLVRRVPVEQPMGLANFRMIYSKKGSDFTDVPFILRTAFVAKTPGEYSRLLNTYAEAELGKETYMHAWNLYRPSIDRNMERLEKGEQVMVAEKNLLNFKTTITEDSGKEENHRPGRITYVWLPDDLAKHRTIRMTFYQFDDGDEQEESINPTLDKKELVLV